MTPGTLMRTWTFVLLPAGLLAGPACDSPGGGGRAFVPRDASDASDVTGDLADVVDDGAEPDDGVDFDAPADTSVPETTVIDTVVADTRPADTGPGDVASTCALGCLPAAPQAGPFVPFTQWPGTTPPPIMGGGDAPVGEWRLAEVDIYPYGTFTEGFIVTITNEGGTAGRAAFAGDAMRTTLALDLRITVDAFGTVGEDTAQATVGLGGCFSVDDNELVGDFAQCAEGWPDELGPPSVLGFEEGPDALLLGIELSAEYLISLLPPEQQANASFVIIGPLTLLATMERP